MSERRLVLVAHGSRKASWRRPIEAYEATLASELGTERVRLAYMKFAGPTLADVAAEAALDGHDHLLVLPLILSGGGHMSHDIPEQIAELQERHPGLTVELLPPVGEHAGARALVLGIASGYLSPD